MNAGFAVCCFHLAALLFAHACLCHCGCCCVARCLQARNGVVCDSFGASYLGVCMAGSPGILPCSMLMCRSSNALLQNGNAITCIVTCRAAANVRSQAPMHQQQWIGQSIADQQRQLRSGQMSRNAKYSGRGRSQNGRGQQHNRPDPILWNELQSNSRKYEDLDFDE